jgi:hypothetical protein
MGSIVHLANLSVNPNGTAHIKALCMLRFSIAVPVCSWLTHNPRHQRGHNMTTSYKTLWQEALRENERLTGEIERLRAVIAASPDDNVRELERTRQIVDLAGIARHTHVERLTPQQWRQRGLLPPVDFPEIKEPLWYVSTIKEQFIKPTRRTWCDHPNDCTLSWTA